MRKTHSRFVLLLSIVLPWVFPAPHALAQSTAEVRDVQVSIRFGEQITFLATISPPPGLPVVSIRILDDLHGLLHEEPLVVQPDGRTEFRFDTRGQRLPPFTLVRWMYAFTFVDGGQAQSETFSVRYADDRFPWRALDSGGLRVRWYEDDALVGQIAMEAAQTGTASIEKWMPVDLSRPIEIYIYANSEDLHGALSPGSESWIAGHAESALGVVLVALEPGVDHRVTLGQRIPHELMHVLLYRRMGAGYEKLPVWLREGMSAFVELQPNENYDRALSEAASADRLIPLAELCDSFPVSAGQAFLAYAEARSFTAYLYEMYGSVRLLELAAAYAGGGDCERVPERVLGAPLSHLERNWRASTLGQDTFLNALERLSPYLVILCLVLFVPFVGVMISIRNKGRQHGSERQVGKQ